MQVSQILAIPFLYFICSTLPNIFEILSKNYGLLLLKNLKAYFIQLWPKTFLNVVFLM